MNKQFNVIPGFADESHERAYWESHDSTEHLDWSKVKKVELAEFEANHQDHFIAFASAFAGRHQNRRKCTRRALPIPDQGLASGKTSQPSTPWP